MALLGYALIPPKSVNATLHSQGDFADVIEVTDLNNLGGPNVITLALKKKNGRGMQKGK